LSSEDKAAKKRRLNREAAQRYRDRRSESKIEDDNKKRRAKRNGKKTQSQCDMEAMSILENRKKNIEQKLSELKAIGESKDINEINRITTELEQLSKEIHKGVYKPK